MFKITRICIMTLYNKLDYERYMVTGCWLISHKVYIVYT